MTDRQQSMENCDILTLPPKLRGHLGAILKVWSVSLDEVLEQFGNSIFHSERLVKELRTLAALLPIHEARSALEVQRDLRLDPAAARRHGIRKCSTFEPIDARNAISLLTAPSGAASQSRHLNHRSPGITGNQTSTRTGDHSKSQRGVMSQSNAGKKGKKETQQQPRGRSSGKVSTKKRVSFAKEDTWGIEDTTLAGMEEVTKDTAEVTAEDVSDKEETALGIDIGRHCSPRAPSELDSGMRDDTSSWDIENSKPGLSSHPDNGLSSPNSDARATSEPPGASFLSASSLPRPVLRPSTPPAKFQESGNSSRFFRYPPGEDSMQSSLDRHSLLGQSEDESFQLVVPAFASRTTDSSSILHPSPTFLRKRKRSRSPQDTRYRRRILFGQPHANDDQCKPSTLHAQQPASKIVSLDKRDHHVTQPAQEINPEASLLTPISAVSISRTAALTTPAINEQLNADQSHLDPDIDTINKTNSNQGSGRSLRDYETQTRNDGNPADHVTVSDTRSEQLPTHPLDLNSEAGAQNDHILQASWNTQNSKIPPNNVAGAVSSLKPGAFLTSTAIEFGLQIFRQPNCKVFDPAYIDTNDESQSQTALQRALVHLSTFTLAIFPLNFDPLHWTLLIFDRRYVKDGTWEFYDSIVSEERFARVEKLWQFLVQAARSDTALQSSSWELHSMKCPQQPNSHACGIYVLVFSIYRMLDYPIPPRILDDLWRKVISVSIQPVNSNTSLPFDLSVKAEFSQRPPQISSSRHSNLWDRRQEEENQLHVLLGGLYVDVAMAKSVLATIQEIHTMINHVHSKLASESELLIQEKKKVNKKLAATKKLLAYAFELGDDVSESVSVIKKQEEQNLISSNRHAQQQEVCQQREQGLRFASDMLHTWSIQTSAVIDQHKCLARSLLAEAEKLSEQEEAYRRRRLGAMAELQAEI